MKKLLVAACLVILPATSWAVCPNPLTVKDAAGATQNISTTNDGSGNCQSAVVIGQTTPGTTNGVAVVGVNAATALAGAGATGTGSQRVTAAQDTTTIAGSAPGTAGTPSANVISVQGVVSGTVLPVAAASGALAAGSGADGWNVTGGAKADAVCGTATGTCSEQALLKFANTQLQSLVSGLLTPPLQVISGGSTYNTVAASQTTQALTGGLGGAVGDYLSHCTVIPTSTSPGVVTIIDNVTTIYAFPGGASSLSNLVPFTIPIGAVSVSGAWKVTTGTGLSVICVGKFH